MERTKNPIKNPGRKGKRDWADKLAQVIFEEWYNDQLRQETQDLIYMDDEAALVYEIANALRQTALAASLKVSEQ